MQPGSRPPIGVFGQTTKLDKQLAHVNRRRAARASVQLEHELLLYLVHALLHWVEADMGNADYWYRRAGKKRATASVASEWQHMAETLSGVTRH